VKATRGHGLSRLSLRQTAAQLTKGALVSLICRLFSAFLGLMWSLLLARILGPADAGLYYLAFSVVLVFSTVSTLGLGNVVVRMVGGAHGVDGPGQSAAVLRSSVILVLSAALVVIVGTYGFGIDRLAALFTSPGLERLLLVMLLAVPALCLISVGSSALQGVRDIAGSALTRGVIAPSVFVCGAVLLHRTLTLEGVAGLFVAGAWVAAGFGFWRWRRLARSARSAAARGMLDGPEVRQLIKAGLPLLGVALLTLVTTVAPTILLGVWQPSDAVGVFASATRVAGVASFLVLAVNAIAAPLMASAHRQGDSADLERIARLSALMVTLSSMPLIALMLLFPAQLMSLFGPEFRIGAATLVILALGYGAKALAGSATVLLMMSGRERSLLRISAWSVAVNLLLCVVLIPLLGINGAALAWTLSIALESALALDCVRRELHILCLPGLTRA